VPLAGPVGDAALAPRFRAAIGLRFAWWAEGVEVEMGNVADGSSGGMRQGAEPGAAAGWQAPPPPPPWQPTPWAPPPPPPAADRGGGKRALAVLLAVAAVSAAVVGGRVASLAGNASGKWESAVRLEVKRSAAAQETVRYLYEIEVPVAVSILRARLVLAELQALAGTPDGSSQAVVIEIAVQRQILAALEPSADLATDTYALDGGGLDLGHRLAVLRSDPGANSNVDPETAQGPGDLAEQKAIRMSFALIPLGFCAFFGAIAHAFASRRREWMAFATASLAIGIAVASIVEVAL
jgi:hypothetical protein